MGKTFIFMSKPRYVTPQINCLGKIIPALRVSTHIYGVSKDIGGDNVQFANKPSHVNPQIRCLGKMSPCSEGFNTHL